VESVFSGAGKFTLEAKSTGTVYLRQIVKVHNNWKYPCLQPTEKAIIARYMLKHGNVSAPSAAPSSTSPDPSSSDAAASAAPSSGSAGPSTTRPPATPPTHPPPTRSVAPTCRCSSAPVENTPYAACVGLWGGEEARVGRHCEYSLLRRDFEKPRELAAAEVRVVLMRHVQPLHDRNALTKGTRASLFLGAHGKQFTKIV